MVFAIPFMLHFIARALTLGGQYIGGELPTNLEWESGHIQASPSGIGGHSER